MTPTPSTPPALDAGLFSPADMALLTRARTPADLSDAALRADLTRVRRLLGRQRTLLRRQQDQQRRQHRQRAIDPTANARTQEKLNAYAYATDALTHELQRRTRVAKTALKEQRLAAAQGNRAARRHAARTKPAATLNPRGLNTKVTPASGITGKVINTHQAAAQRRKGDRRRAP